MRISTQSLADVVANALVPIAFVFFCSCNGDRQASPRGTTPEHVTIFDLVEHPERYVGRRIQVLGYLQLDSEWPVLCPSGLEADAMHVGRSAWVNMKPATGFISNLPQPAMDMGFAIIEAEPLLTKPRGFACTLSDSVILGVFRSRVPSMVSAANISQALCGIGSTSPDERLQSHQILIRETGMVLPPDARVWQEWWDAEGMLNLSSTIGRQIEEQAFGKSSLQ
jgi:hypothetical protein